MPETATYFTVLGYDPQTAAVVYEQSFEAPDADTALAYAEAACSGRPIEQFTVIASEEV